MNKEKIIKLIDFWQQPDHESRPALYTRDILESIVRNSKEIIDIIGPRRCGKSSVMRLLTREEEAAGKSLFMNFEDPFFIEQGDASVIDEIIDVYLEYYNAGLRYLFFDEIQNINGWERALRKIRDAGTYGVCVTGSSSKLLGGELATLLTGRHLSYTLFPLSFGEYLAFNGISVRDAKDLALQETALGRMLDDYLRTGGFPEIALTRNMALLKQYYGDIVSRDIMGRYEIRQRQVLEKMGVFLMSHAAKTVSIASLEKTFGISFELASTYLEYFREAMLVFDLPQFSHSLKTQQKSLKKIYAVDTGIANAVSFRFSEDRGRILENAVYLHLKRRGGELYYYKTNGNREVDFFTQLPDGVQALIQVCWDPGDHETRERELKALSEAMLETGLRTAFIVTRTGAETIRVEGGVIEAVPAWRFLLDAKMPSR